MSPSKIGSVRISLFGMRSVTYSEKTLNANKLLPGLVIIDKVVRWRLVALRLRGKDRRAQCAVLLLDLFHVQLSNARELADNSTGGHTSNHVEHFVNLNAFLLAAKRINGVYSNVPFCRWPVRFLSKFQLWPQHEYLRRRELLYRVY